MPNPMTLEDIAGVDPTGVIKQFMVERSGDRRLVDLRRALGLITETYDLSVASNNGAPGLQQLFGMAVYLYRNETITGVAMPVMVQASLTTYGRVGMFDVPGNRLAISNDLTTVLNGAGTGMFQLPFSAPWTPSLEGLYYVALLFDGGTPPSIARHAPGAAANVNGVGSFPRRGVFQAGQAAMPATATWGQSGNGGQFALGLY